MRIPSGVLKQASVVLTLVCICVILKPSSSHATPLDQLCDVNGCEFDFNPGDFLDYTEASYNPSHVTAKKPKSGMATGLSVVDTAKPTIVITHGFQPTTYPNWVAEMRNAIGSRANVIEWIWPDAFTQSLRDATSAVADQGTQLAKHLRTLAVGQNEGLLDHVQFIGHSLGSLVNGYATKNLVDRGIGVEQFTILDRPFGTTLGSKLLFDTQDPNYLAVSQQQPGNLDEPIFRQLLPKNSVKWVDNYFGRQTLSLTPATGDTFYDPVKAYNKSIPNADHVEVHEWYECTITLTSDCFGEFDDLNGGFVLSRAATTKPHFPDGTKWDPGANNVTSSKDLLGEDSELAWLRFNCTAQLTGGETCVEGSPAYLWIDALTIPIDGTYLTFDFNWLSPGDGDWLSLNFGDELLFNFSGSSANANEWMNSGLIPLAGLGGMTDQLLFTLNSVGESNAAFSIRSLRFLRANSVPEPESLLLVLIGLGLLGWSHRYGRQATRRYH